MKISASQRQSILDYWGDLLGYAVSTWKMDPYLTGEEMARNMVREFRSQGLDLIQARVLAEEAAKKRENQVIGLPIFEVSSAGR